MSKWPRVMTQLALPIRAQYFELCSHQAKAIHPVPDGKCQTLDSSTLGTVPLHIKFPTFPSHYRCTSLRRVQWKLLPQSIACHQFGLYYHRGNTPVCQLLSGDTFLDDLDDAHGISREYQYVSNISSEIFVVVRLFANPKAVVHFGRFETNTP